MTAPAPDHNRAPRFFGLVLMAVGGLIAATCGLCTLVVAGGGLVALVASGANVLQGLPGALTILVTALVIGGAPAGVGVLLFIAGRRMFRRGRELAPVDIDKTFS